MPTTQVILIRHGQSQGNAEGRFGGHTDTPLSARGRKQAEATAKALASEKFDAIYSSDLPRAIETATPLARLTGAPLITTDAFRERSVGVMEGLTFEEAATYIRNNTQPYFDVISSMCLKAERVTGKRSTARRASSTRLSRSTKAAASRSSRIPAPFAF